ncbi:MAG TPA: protein kinase [Pyrinomonadaceae bacterium]|nr:protein kinase [Pyrinomonadaceae bacterium]
MDCPNCHQPLREGAQFCTRCGARTSDAGGTSHGGAQTASDGGSQPTVVGVHLEPDAADPFVGRVLEGKYEIVAPLGAGGMGAVYLARRVLIGDEVAVKVLHSRFTNDEKLVERFRREARAAAQLQHPNVVTIHDYGEARGRDGFAYIVMELVRGESLRQLLKREGRLGAARAVALMRGVCAGVGAAHRRGIVHRDIKPDNVIVSPEDDDNPERVKVVDFGIAKIRDVAAESTLTEAGSMVGTLFYMAPEQCKGEPLDARADVYSLGAMLYEMLAGSPPFTAPSITSIILKHVHEPPPPLPADLGVPPALAAAVMRALAKDPDQRPRDATEFSREIQAALNAPEAPTLAINNSTTASGSLVDSAAGRSTQSAEGSTQSAEPFFPATARPVPVTPTNPTAANTQSQPTPPPSTTQPTPDAADHEEVTVVRNTAGLQAQRTDVQAQQPNTYAQQPNPYAPAPRPGNYAHAQQPAPHGYAPAPPPHAAPVRRSRKGYVLGLLFVALVGLAGLTVVGVLLYMNRGGGTTVNVNARPTPTPRANTNANANVSPTPTPLPDAMQSAEVKVLGGTLLSPADATGMTALQLRFLRNTVYARHGRTFSDTDLRQYFQTRPWYKPDFGYDEDQLTTNDRANADLLKAFEENDGQPPRADVEKVKKDVQHALEDWAESTRDRKLDDHMKHYADMLETYYKRQNVGAAQVRIDRNSAFTRYDQMDVKLDNFQITPDPTGLRATAVFDKTWEFDSPDKNNKGSVRQQLTLIRAGGRWLINGEKDVQVYYTDSQDYTNQ